jgi:hypothetical protein
MNMSKLRRALERGNKVVLFDKLPDPLRPGSRILYESYAVFAKFEDLQESGKYQQNLNLQRRSPVGAKAVIVPDLDQLPGGAAARHELAGLVELLAGYSIREVCIMTGLDPSFVHAVHAVCYGDR